jgi:hypothetical protein
MLCGEKDIKQTTLGRHREEILGRTRKRDLAMLLSTLHL